jgi:pentatricopeptide repeat protein
MKKFIILAGCMAMAVCTYAQESVLKEAERGLRVEVPDHSKIATMLRGAMADPTTSNNVKTWYLAGKNDFQTWQTGYELLQAGNNSDPTSMSRAIVEGYQFYMKALTMDTIIDEKGKAKTKYSKEITKTIASNYKNFYDAGVYLYQAQDLKAAYHAWEIYSELPTLACLGKDAPAAPIDSLRAETYYNMGIFAYQSDMKEEALSSFTKAAKLGHGSVAYENALAMASDLGRTDDIVALAQEGFAKYGTQNYIGALVNVYVKTGDYDKALDMVNKAMEDTPNNAMLYNVKGILTENHVNQEGLTAEQIDAYNTEATEYYKQAAELDPEYAEGQYNYGRMLANRAYKISDDAYQLSTSEFNKLSENTIKPLFKEAAGYLEKAIAIAPESNRDAYTILKNIYYNLKDEENMNRISELQLQ